MTSHNNMISNQELVNGNSTYLEDQRILTSVYDEVFPSVETYILKNNGNKHDAEDIFQEALLIFMKKIRTNRFELTSSLKTFLFSICKNLWLKKLRDAKPSTYKLPNYLSTEINIDDITPPPSNEEKLKSWFSSMSFKCQLILKALFIKEESAETLMYKMGWKNKQIVANQKHKCIKQIRLIVKDKVSRL